VTGLSLRQLQVEAKQTRVTSKAFVIAHQSATNFPGLSAQVRRSVAGPQPSSCIRLNYTEARKHRHHKPPRTLRFRSPCKEVTGGKHSLNPTPTSRMLGVLMATGHWPLARNIPSMLSGTGQGVGLVTHFRGLPNLQYRRPLRPRTENAGEYRLQSQGR
jgi:hypothetical protein